MSNSERPEQAIEAEAAAWVVRCEAGPLTNAEREEFEAWVTKSEAHAAAYALARRTWAELSRLRPSASRAGEPVRQARHQTDRRERLVARTVSRRRVWQSLAAAAAITMVAGAFYAADLPVALRADHRTAPGETRTVMLPDGSSVELNTASAIALRFDTERREVQLLAGEAAFSVASVTTADPRSFLVRAGSGSVKALGTRFVVHRHESGVDVTVLEHQVEVSLGEDAATDRRVVILGPAQAVHYDADSGLGQVRPIDPDRTAAWLRGRLVFDHVPLGQVVAELNRYRRGPIVVLNPALARRHVSGVLPLDRLDESVRTIARELGARHIAIPPFLTALY